MFDGRWRHGVDEVTRPVGRQLVRMGITADVLTASGLVFAVATAVVVATGHLLIGIPLLAVTGFHDLFDGPVAKAGGTASVRGAFFDSVADRVGDAVVMGGVAWYLVSVHKGELALLPLAVLGAASIVSYVRAKAEALGLPATNGGLFGGLMERGERMVLLGAGFLEPWLLVPVLWALLGLTLVTAVARFVGAWRTAEPPAPSVRLERVARLEPGRRTERAARPARARRPVRQDRESRFAGFTWPRVSDGSPVHEGGLTQGDGGLARTERGELAARWRARRQEALATREARSRARRERADAARLRRRASAQHGQPGAGDRDG